MYAARLVVPNDFIYIDAGTTTEYETGRVTAITDSELEKVIKESSEKLGINF